MFDGPIDSCSKKTSRVGTSTTHNEYIAMSECARRLRFCQDLLLEMGFPQFVDQTLMEKAHRHDQHRNGYKLVVIELNVGPQGPVGFALERMKCNRLIISKRQTLE